MHSVVRTAKAGSPLGRAINGKVPPAVPLLKPSKATTLHQRTQPAVAAFSTNALAYRSGSNLISPRVSSLLANRMHWTRQLHTTQPSAALGTPTSANIQELEQLLAKGEYAGFQQACIAASTSPTKDSYHFLLRTLAEQPKAFAPLSTSTATNTETFDPLNSAIGILTDMSREANMNGKTALQPDRETLLLLLRIAGSKERLAPSSSQLQEDGDRTRWESARLLVDALRHGRLPAVMSPDQWELPDLNIELDQELWKGMFACVNAAAGGVHGKQFQDELDTTMYLMADQLNRSQDVQMDEQLWGYVIEAYGNSGSTTKLRSTLSRLPDITHATPELYSTVAEALANCGSTARAMHIMHTLNNTHSNLPSIKPFIALARQHVKTGNYEALRSEYKMWTAKGQSSAVNDASIIDLHRAMLSASATALDRMVSVVSRVLKDRQANTLPDDVLPGMMTPPQLSLLQFGEASYLWIRTQEAINGITEDRLTQEDYDTIMRILTRLNLLQPSQWSLEKHARKVIPEMKQRGLKPLKSTYFTLMETIARTREYGASRGNGQVARQARKVFEEMTQEGYAATSAKDFRPLIEACFGIYSHSPFVAGQWMYSNQLYPVCNSALEKVEQMMQKALAPEDQGESSSSTGSNSIHRYHDSTTIAALLAGLAHGDQVDELWKRWDDLALQGIERDAKLYQTVIGASQGQEKLAQYVLRTVRYEMQKEQPPIPMTPEIFSGLLNCCVRAQDTISARSLIAQCSLSGEIQKSAEWYVPMVRTCLVLEGLEEEGTFLLEEMRKSDMKMDSFSGSFYEFLMSYFVTKRMDHQAGREIFKRFVQSEQQKITELLEARERMKHIRLDEELEDDQQQVLIFSNKELTKRARRLQAPVEHLVERVDISARTASMLNLLMLSYIRERMTLLEHEQRSGFGAGAQEHLRNARAVIHCLVGERKVHQLAQGMGLQTSSVSIPNTIISSPESQGSDSLSRLLDQSLLTSQSRVPEPGHQSNGRLIFVNKYALGEYIDTCIKEGSPEMLEEASWALNRIMPRVIGEARIAKDTQRLRQALENARSRQYGEMDI